MYKVSIIVPCYNQSVYLSEALDSVLEQSYENWECIIVDDGSTDNTENVAKEYCKKDNRFIYIYQNNSGLSKARNTGVANSKGIYILPLDSDDKIAPQYIEHAINAFKSNENLKIVYCRAQLFGLGKGEWKLPEYSLERMLGRNCIFCSGVYKKEDFIRVGGYNPNMKYGFEDWDFWLSILEKGGDVLQLDEILFFYRIRNKSMVRSLDDERYSFLRKQIWENHKSLYAENFLNPTECFEYILIKDIISSRKYKYITVIFDFLSKIKRIFKF